MNQYEEQLEKDKAARTLEEIQTFADKSKINLGSEELARVAGGWREPHQDLPKVSACPRCGSSDITYFYEGYVWYAMSNRCKKCGWSDVA